jgi:hypothetical protein
MTTIDDPEDERIINEAMEKTIRWLNRPTGIREGETWLEFQSAAELIRDRLDCSPGEARQTLRELCECGRVRSISCAEEERAISPGEWAKEALDIGCHVDINVWDLAYWLDNERPTKIDGLSRTSKKRELASQAIKALWPEGIPEIPNGEIEKQVGNWITSYCEQNKTRRLEISSDTILRAAGRK